MEISVENGEILPFFRHRYQNFPFFSRTDSKFLPFFQNRFLCFPSVREVFFGVFCGAFTELFTVCEGGIQTAFGRKFTSKEI